MTDDQLSAAIQSATSSVFSTLLNLEVSAGTAFQQTDPQPIDGVMALLGFTGNWVGTGIFYCQEKLACQLSSTMLMSPISEVNNDVLDGVGELANMIMGNLKDSLEPLIGGLGMSVPTVVYGRNFQTRSTMHRNWLVVHFTVGEDTFEIRVCLVAQG